jgi:hypothetical protein
MARIENEGKEEVRAQLIKQRQEEIEKEMQENSDPNMRLLDYARQPEEKLGSILPMALSDCYAWGRDGINDSDWGATYRVMQSIMKMSFPGMNVPNHKQITDQIYGKSAAKRQRLDCLDALAYFSGKSRPSSMHFRAYKYTRHNKWYNGDHICTRLDKYKDLPASTL